MNSEVGMTRSRRHETGVLQKEFRIPKSDTFFIQPTTDPRTNDNDCIGIGCWLFEHMLSVFHIRCC